MIAIISYIHCCFLAVTLTIQRLGGTNGVVQVNYTTLAPDETYPYIPTTVPRADLQDYTMTSGSVTFTSGQGVGTFQVDILDDLEPEESEAVYVMLTGIKLLEGAQIRPGIRHILLPRKTY